jgi:hypothetical protein
MLFLSKAQEISKLNGLLNQNAIGRKEYDERLSDVLDAPYRPFSTGISEEEERRLLWELVVDGVIRQRDYDVQTGKIRRASAFGYEEARREPLPQIKKKKGYIAPIVWIIIGILCCHSFWLFPLGIIIIILSLIWFSCRVGHNKRAEVENSENMMRYGSRYQY